MADKNRIADKSTMHRYRIELPILIDDLDLSVYEFRLYVRFKRRAGDGGSCYEGTRSLADACGMSMGQVSKAKKSLEKKGLIRLGTKQTRGGQTDEVTLIDLWPRNFKAYADDESVHLVNTNSESVHTVNTSDESVHTTNTLSSKRSPGERKNHDQYHIESDSNTPPPALNQTRSGGGGDSYETEVRQLLGGYNILGAAQVAKKYAAMDDRPTLDVIRAAVVSMAGSDPQIPNRIYRRLMDCPPPWPELRAVAKGAAPLTPTRPNVPETTVAPAEMLRIARERR